MAKRFKPSKIPIVETISKKEQDLNNTEVVLFRLKSEATEAIKAGDHKAFLLAEKKIMLTGISYSVRFKSLMSKKKKKPDINHINEALLGTLAIIMELDNDWKAVHSEEQDNE